MPRLPIDYQKTIIYKIVCNDLKITDCYVGHTTDMTKRKNCHKSCCNNEKFAGFNEKKYVTIRANGGWTNWVMVMVEKFPCNNEEEARMREREVYEILGANMNRVRPYRSPEEKVEQDKEYIETHKEQKNEKNKEYNKTHKEQNQVRNKEYYETHKEQNREKISEKHKERIECPLCGKNLAYASLSKHKRNSCPNRLVQPVL